MAENKIYRLLVGDIRRRVTPEVYRELVDLLLPVRVPTIILTVIAGMFGWLIHQRTGSTASAVFTIIALVLAVVRLGHIELYERTRLGRPRTERQTRLSDMVFTFLSVAFGFDIGLLCASAILQPDIATRTLGYVLCIGYGCGVVARTGFRAHATHVTLGMFLIPVTYALASNIFADTDAAQKSVDIALAVATLLLSYTSYAIANRSERLVSNHLTTRRKYFALARMDPLTGTANRLSLHELYDEARAARRSVAVHCLDLDRFKAVNDHYGHSAGDALLVYVSQRIQGILRSDDMLARIGGDEFVILQLDVESQRDAALLAERLLHVIVQPYVVEGHRAEVGVSIGSAIAPPGATFDTVFTAADQALYRAKNEGRARAVMAEIETPIAFAPAPTPARAAERGDGADDGTLPHAATAPSGKRKHRAVA